MMKKEKYDYLLIGAGLFNAIFVREANKQGRKCLVVERRSHVGGNLHCEEVEGINVHRYGAHIFHTKDKYIWDYMSELCEFNHYINSPLARYKDELYNMPFNMNTFYQLWKVSTPKAAIEIISKQRLKTDSPQNCEEQALSLVGTDIYLKLIKGYTEKQWGRDAKELPAFIIKRLPLRFTFNNNYFSDPYQGIPKGGYNDIFEKCFANSDVLLNTDFLSNRHLAKEAKKVIFTGMIDQYYNNCFGALEYRSLHFVDEIHDCVNYQGNAVINYTEKDIPYTRVLEHKHFEFGEQGKTVVTKEFPLQWKQGLEPYYPVNTEKNNRTYEKYKERANLETNVVFAGRLGSYKYYDMDQIVKGSIELHKKLNNLNN